MKKKWLLILLPMVLCAALWLAWSHRAIPGWERPEWISLSQSRRIQRELKAASQILSAVEDSRDAREAALTEAGFTVEDTDPIYPSYLSGADKVRDFAAGKTAALSILRVQENGILHHLFFTRTQEPVLMCTTVSLSPLQVIGQEILPLYEAEVSDWEVFYYRCYPSGDPHYSDYIPMRLTPPNREYWDLLNAYILPVGYQMVNLFLRDWREGDWGQVCLNDVFEYLYALETGEDFPWQTLTPRQGTGWYDIDAAVFEGTLLPYFSLTRQELRELCRYDPLTDTYPWRPVEGNDIICLDHAYRQPEVVNAESHPDGTLTLTVQVGYPDEKTNNRFTHAVTVRPLPNGGFQYVGNQVTYVSPQGLPPSIPRFDLT